MTTIALLPAYNEEDRIANTVHALCSRHQISEVVVIDDCSSDGTGVAAKLAGASEVIRMSKNGGKGAALRAGFLQTRQRADIFLLLDADLGSSAVECIKLLAPIERDLADMAIALLPSDLSLDEDGSSGGGMGLVVRLARWGLKRSTGHAWSQPLSGQRAVRRAVLDSFHGDFAHGFGVEVALTQAAVRAGFRVVEVETYFRHRVTNNDWSDLLHRGRQFVDVARAVFTSSLP